MMNVQQAYDLWSGQYDTNVNKTRDLEARVLRTTLPNISFDRCLEIGCGTGKNTEWLISKARQVTAVDLSTEMLTIARQKVQSVKAQFIQADITQSWNFAHTQYDLITFSLVLEHIENLNEIFKKASRVIIPGGIVYVGELHPFKQYTGTKARFETEAGQQVVTCFTHHISDFTQAAKNNDFEILDLSEFFDDDAPASIPRILVLMLRKQ